MLIAEFFAPSPEAEIFYTFSTYIVVFTAKNDAFLRDLWIKMFKKFASGDRATPFRIRPRSIYAKISAALRAACFV